MGHCGRLGQSLWIVFVDCGSFQILVAVAIHCFSSYVQQKQNCYLEDHTRPHSKKAFKPTHDTVLVKGKLKVVI